ncbi:hypothetical protein HDU84_001820 [Entophlyctis sp. JEL0112]|nr:hypothetical protein HDU84_001820 [Entophlyctis sp. JEL0112]
MFVFPFDALPPDDELHATVEGHHDGLKYCPDDPTVPDHLSAAAELDSLARRQRSTAHGALVAHGFSIPPLLAEIADADKGLALAASVERICIRSSAEFVAGMLGHMGTGVCALIRTVFYAGADIRVEEMLTLVEKLIDDGDHVNADKRFPRLARNLRNTDALHQALLRAQRSLVRAFASPFAQTVETMPAFPVFDSETGIARPAFKRRNLNKMEALHPFLPRTESRNEKYFYFTTATDVPVGAPSVVFTLEMFKRSFNVFTAGLLNKVPLGRNAAVVAGGAVAACLHPWPQSILKLYAAEKFMERFQARLFSRFPPEILLMIESYAQVVGALATKTDVALFDHLCGPASPYAKSDVDIFFVCPNGSTSVDVALDHFPKVHSAVVKNRSEATPLIRNFISDKDLSEGKHWISNLRYGFLQDDWFVIVKNEVEHVPRLQPSSETYTRNTSGWNSKLEEKLAARLKLLWTVRTTNSVTITGCHPVRHVQLMLPVVRAPEQVVYPFDLDCVTVFFDGSNVYATPRSLRSFNTRTNFVDRVSLQDRARCVRMMKYASRGFSTVAFEVCRHFPRCDIDASQLLREVIERRFKSLVYKAPPEKDLHSDDEDEFQIPLRFNPEAGGDTVEPPGNIIGMDYTPAPLLYGRQCDPSDLLTQIQTFEDPSTFKELVNKKPIVRRLEFRITSNPENFKSEISTPRFGSLIPMQFKFLKDGVIGRRVQFATGFHMCYICKKDVDQEAKADSDKDELQSSSESSTDDDTKDQADSVEEVKEVEAPENAQQPPKQIVICASCNELNQQKRDETVDLRGKVALVTGGRVKIGHAVVLRLLRNGAEVHVTTRFPLMLLHSLRQQKDCDSWWSRLHVYGLDLRDLTTVSKFCDWLNSRLEKLDILIQNAAQTVRRPAAYYAPLVQTESELRSNLDAKVLANWVRFDGSSSLSTLTLASETEESGENLVLRGVTSAGSDSVVLPRLSDSDISPSALRTLLRPADVQDLDRQVETDKKWSLTTHASRAEDPFDLRASTSWTQALPNVPLSEMAEVLVINSLAPMLLLQRLQRLLSPAVHTRTHPTFVVNVSSREGSFSATSGRDDLGLGFDDAAGAHPHTNMAKSALNRLTQTIAADWAREGIYVNAVDPGWVSLMGPVVMEDGKGIGGRAGIIPPLSVEDGAARILHPVVSGFNGRGLVSGLLFRNFSPSDW